MDPKDRREYPRFEGKFQVDLLNLGDDPSISQFEAVIPGEALDVSRKGMRLKVTYRVPVGTFLSAMVYYKNRESICLCEVVWRRELMGEQLYGLYVKEWSTLDRFLEEQLAKMENPTQFSALPPVTTSKP